MSSALSAGKLGAVEKVLFNRKVRKIIAKFAKSKY